MGGHGTSPCASCKLLRRRCAKDCIFAPYFPSDDPHKFAIVHKVFGASNISKMLQELSIDQRADAVSSLVYEATARLRDPVYGCVGAISYLQNQVSQLQMQLAVAQAEIMSGQMHPKDPTPENHIEVSDGSLKSSSYLHNRHHQHQYQYQHEYQHEYQHQHQQQYYDFTSSSDSVINQDSFKRESFFGNGIIS